MPWDMHQALWRCWNSSGLNPRDLRSQRRDAYGKTMSAKAVRETGREPVAFLAAAFILGSNIGTTGTRAENGNSNVP